MKSRLALIREQRIARKGARCRVVSWLRMTWRNKRWIYRWNLARQLVESVVTPDALTDQVKQGIQRIEDVAAGRVVGLTEEQFRSALG